MSNQCTNVFENSRELQLDALNKAKADEAKRLQQIEHLNQIRQAIAIRDAKEHARLAAQKEAETNFKLKEREILEKQLEEAMAVQKRMQEQYEVFVDTTSDIAELLQNPACLFPSSTIVGADQFEDYFKLTYDDGRIVKLPTAVLDFLLSDKLKSWNQAIAEQSSASDEIREEVVANAEEIEKLLGVMRNLVNSIATHEAEQIEKFETFSQSINQRICLLEEAVLAVSDGYKHVDNMISKLEVSLSVLLAGSTCTSE